MNKDNSNSTLLKENFKNLFKFVSDLAKSKINILNSPKSLFNLLLLSENEYFLNNNTEVIANGFYKNKTSYFFKPY